MLQLMVLVERKWAGIDLDDQSSVTLEYESPLFQDEAFPLVHSYEVSIPATPHNSIVFGAPEIYAQDSFAMPMVYENALIMYDGIVLLAAVCTLYPEATTERYTIVFYQKDAYLMANRNLRSHLYSNPIVQPKAAYNGYMMATNALALPTSPFYFAPVYAPDIYETPPTLPTYLNLLNSYDIGAGTFDPLQDKPVVPFFRVAYLLEKLMFENGITLDGTILADAEYQALLLFNNYVLSEAFGAHPSTTVTITPANHVPNMTVAEFCNAIRVPWNAVFIFSVHGGYCRLMTKDEILGNTTITDISGKIVAIAPPRHIHTVDWTRDPYNIAYEEFEANSKVPDTITPTSFPTLLAYFAALPIEYAYIASMNWNAAQYNFINDAVYPVISDPAFDTIVLPFTPLPLAHFPALGAGVPHVKNGWVGIYDPLNMQDAELDKVFSFFWRGLQPNDFLPVPAIIPQGSYHNIGNDGNAYSPTAYSLAFQAGDSVYGYFHYRWAAFKNAQKIVTNQWLVSTEELTDADLFVRKYQLWSGQTYVHALLKSLSVTISRNRMAPAVAAFAIIPAIPAGCQTYHDLIYTNTFTGNITPLTYGGVLIGPTTSAPVPPYPAGWVNSFRFNNAAGAGALYLTAPTGYAITFIEFEVIALGVTIPAGHPTKLEHLEVWINGAYYVLLPSQLSNNVPTYSVTTVPTNYFGTGIIVPAGAVINDQEADFVPFTLTISGIAAHTFDIKIIKDLGEANGVVCKINTLTICPHEQTPIAPIIAIQNISETCTASGLASVTVVFSVTNPTASTVISIGAMSATISGATTTYTFNNVPATGGVEVLTITNGGTIVTQAVTMPNCTVPVCACDIINVSTIPATIGNCDGQFYFELDACTAPSAVTIYKQMPGTDPQIYPVFDPAAGCLAPLVVPFGTAYFVTGVSAATYLVFVTDDAGCFNSTAIIVIEI